MKKWMICLMLLGLVFTLCSCSSKDDSADYVYVLQDDGTAHITQYTGIASKLTVPGKLDGHVVTAIGAGAFSGCPTLTDLTLPDSITTFGSYPFIGLISLERVTLPRGAISVGELFYDCPELKTIIVPEGVQELRNNAFRNCTALESITLPSSLRSIGTYALAGCSALKEIVIPEGVTSISAHAFLGCRSLQRVTLPGSLTNIGSQVTETVYTADAFLDCALDIAFTVPAGSYAAEYCEQHEFSYKTK